MIIIRLINICHNQDDKKTENVTKKERLKIHPDSLLGLPGIIEQPSASLKVKKILYIYYI